jgi:hypothetical protein
VTNREPQDVNTLGQGGPNSEMPDTIRGEEGGADLLTVNVLSAKYGKCLNIYPPGALSTWFA